MGSAGRALIAIVQLEGLRWQREPASATADDVTCRFYSRHVWADNETSVDLLGFDYLVDQLEVVLTDARLRPITVGVLGDWGSGKTSLMYMTARGLRDRDGYAVVTFSPWRYESTDEVKLQLMVAVLRELERWIDRIDPQEKEKRRVARAQLGKLVELLRMFVAKGAVPAATAGAAALGLPAEAGTVVGGVVSDLAATPAEQPDADAEPDEEGPLPDASEFSSVAEFHDELKALMRAIDRLEALIVLIDDLDRCLPDTIIEIFETVRLFLHVPNSAFVVAAHPQIVEAAVAHRYVGNRDGDANLGRDYLEKIIHLPIVVPPLSRAEVESYINLLFCELHCEPETFAALHELATTRRANEPLGVAMNYGIALEVFADGKLPDRLAAAFELSNKIGSILGEGLKGNPRQVKRFLNALQLRLVTAKKRRAKLDASILAKLMVLELDQVEFQQLFEWQLSQDGDPVELRHAESAVRDEKEPSEMSAEAKAWAARPVVERWLRLDPPLAGTALGTYFFYSRDRLSPVAGGARLTGAQQELLARLQLTAAAQRRGAVEDTAALGSVDRFKVYRALLERVARDPTGAAMASALELAVGSEDLVPDFSAQLRAIPPRSIAPQLPLQIMAAFQKAPPAAVGTVFDEWQKSGPKALTASVTAARKPK